MSETLEKIRVYGLKTSLRFALGETRHILFNRLLRGSYSQCGEDLLVESLLGGKKEGFYVDIGANHPTRYNNTARFHKRGWSGINVEPDPVQHKKLLSARRNDINLNIGIGLESGALRFYRFFPDGFSTFSEEQAARAVARGLRLVEAVDVQVRRLDEVLVENLGERTIDFLSVDTEGFEREVLLSNDWERFRPRVIIIESTQAACPGESPSFAVCERILTDAGYSRVSSTALNSIYSVHGDNSTVAAFR